MSGSWRKVGLPLLRDDRVTPETKIVDPHQMGWLRRPELDDDRISIEVWEKPDGELYAHSKTQPKLRLQIWKRSSLRG